MELQQRIYSVGPWRSRVLYGVWGALVAPLTAGGLATRSSTLLALAAIVTVITLPIFIWVLRNARLTLGPEGIEVRQAGATLRTSWANVDQILLARGAEGFVTRAPIGGKGAARSATTSQMSLRGVSLYDSDRRNLIAARRFIPIDAFAHWLRRGDLRDVLREYAPTLMTEAEAFAARVDRHAPTVTTSATAGVVIVVLAAVFGILSAVTGSESRVVRVVAAVMAAALGILGARSGLSAARLFGARSIGSGLFWAGFAVLQILMMLALLTYVAN